MPSQDIFFTFSRQKGATSKQAVGIRSRNEKGNKHWRFRMMLPMFENGNIWFPKELEHTADLAELLEELRYVSYGGFGARHDDGMDLISMIGAMKYTLPSKQEVNKRNKVGMKVSPMNAKIWGKTSDDEEAGTAYDSYA